MTGRSTVRLIESRTCGLVWVTGRWGDLGRLPWWPVYHERELDRLAKLSKRPVQVASLQGVARVKLTFPGAVVTDVQRRFRAYRRRGFVRPYAGPPREVEADLDDED